MIDRNMKPSEIFLGLWRQWARTEKSGVEDFTVCAETWAEIRRMEAESALREFFRPVNPDPAPIPSFGTEKDVGGASPSPTEEKEPERGYSAYVDYAGEMHGPFEGPLPAEAGETRAVEDAGPYKKAEAEAEADGVQSGPEEPDPEAGMSFWMRRRLRIQRRVLATRFSTQQIADASEKQLTVAEIRAFCDSYAALQGGKLKYLEEAMDKLEGKT